METKSLECFGTDPRARGVRVEVSPRQTYILAHEHFLYAECNTSPDGDAVKLVFVSHEVVLAGHGLRRIETAIQTRELAWLVAKPERYRSLAGERPFITAIHVRDLHDADREKLAPTEGDHAANRAET